MVQGSRWATSTNSRRAWSQGSHIGLLLLPCLLVLTRVLRWLGQRAIRSLRLAARPLRSRAQSWGRERLILRSLLLLLREREWQWQI